MTARWHLGPISGWDFWWLLVSSPEILVFLFFMITDPKTIPRGRAARLVYAVGVGLLATLLIAPQTTEFATKVAVLAALALVCLGRPLLERALPAAASPEPGAPVGVAHLRRPAARARSASWRRSRSRLVALDGIPARPEAAAASLPAAASGCRRSPSTAVAGVSSNVDRRRRERSRATRPRSPDRGGRSSPPRPAASVGRCGRRLARRPAAADGAATGRPGDVPDADERRPDPRSTPRRRARARRRSSPTCAGRSRPRCTAGSPPLLERRVTRCAVHPHARAGAQRRPLRDRRLARATARRPAARRRRRRRRSPRAGARGRPAPGRRRAGRARLPPGRLPLRRPNDLPAMMGGGLCWLDYDGDGWLDLFVVNSYADPTRPLGAARRPPGSALFHNVRRAFVDVSRAHARRPRGSRGRLRRRRLRRRRPHRSLRHDAPTTSCSGTTATARSSEGADAAGRRAFGWHTGAAVATSTATAGPTSSSPATPTSPDPRLDRRLPDELPGRPRPPVPERGPRRDGRATFREVGVAGGARGGALRPRTRRRVHGLDGDGRPDLYVANDEDPNRLYENVAWPGGAQADPAGLGFRFEERRGSAGVADPNAGMGIAAGDYDGDGRPDLLRDELARPAARAFARSAPEPAGRRSRTRAPVSRRRSAASSTGWGASWVDLDLDGTPSS